MFTTTFSNTTEFGAVWPELGETLEIHELPPTTEALNARDPPPPLLLIAKLSVRLPGDSVVAAKWRIPGATWSCGLAGEIVNRTGRSMEGCAAFPGVVMWMVAGKVPALMVPGSAVTVSGTGVTPASGVTPIHAGAGVPAEPASTDTANLIGVAHVEKSPIVCEGAALPPANAEKASAVPDTCNRQAVELVVTEPVPVSVNGMSLDVVPLGAEFV